VNAKRKNFSENRHFEKEEGSSPRKKKTLLEREKEITIEKRRKKFIRNLK
jgi:hypothetical protein